MASAQRAQQVPPSVAAAKPALFTVPQPTARARAYQRAWRALGLIGACWYIAGLVLLLRAGPAAWARDCVYRLLRTAARPRCPPLRAVAIYVPALSLALSAWSLPITLAGYYVESRYGFSRETLGVLIGDEARGVAFSALYIVPVWMAFCVYARVGAHWWKWAWCITVGFLVAETVLYPVVIAPLYNRYDPLRAGSLRTRILALARRCGVTSAQIFVESTSTRTTHVNAYVTGLGPSTRIVINDTALRVLPDDQVVVMVAHELGHYVGGDRWIELVSGALGAGAFLWGASGLLPWVVRRYGQAWRVREVGDLAALPLVLLTISVFLLVQQPVAAAESRYLEHRADMLALRETHLNAAMAGLFQGFVTRDYDDPDPPAWLQFWFGDHPTIASRIRFARDFHG